MTINFMLHHYIGAQQLIVQEVGLTYIKDGNAPMEDDAKERIQNNFKFLLTKATEYGFPTVTDRIERIFTFLRLSAGSATWSEFQRHAHALREAYDADTKFFYLYAYPKDKVRLFLMAQGEWAPAMAAFPGIKDDIIAACDLYALGHNLPCVFYLMRVMEVGVQKFGKKLGVSLVKKTTERLADSSWHQILNDLNPKLKALDQTTKAGKAKHEKFSAIQSYLFGVKDAWRNPTMHPRREGYNDLQALDLINHVRSFMNELASVISPRAAAVSQP